MNAEKEFNDKLKNAVTDVNGGLLDLKVITDMVQDPNPVTFSQQCGEKLLKINPESLINYSTTVIPMPTGRGLAMIFIAVIQYWGSDEDFKAYEDEIRRKNLLIKP